MTRVPRLKLAMRIGGEYSLGRIEGRQWHRLAGGLGLDPDVVVARIDELRPAHRKRWRRPRRRRR
jgi:serine/threonine-protein kinase HipA